MVPSAHHPALFLIQLGIDATSGTDVVKPEPMSKPAVPIPAYFWS